MRETGEGLRHFPELYPPGGLGKRISDRLRRIFDKRKPLRTKVGQTLSSVAEGLRPAEFHEKVRGSSMLLDPLSSGSRRLKGGGSQDWLPHFFAPVKGKICFFA